MNTQMEHKPKGDAVIYRPCIGMRFILRGCEFEVCHAEFGMVRYATTKGGKPHQIATDRFKTLQRDGEIAIANPALHGQDVVDGAPTFPNLSEGELSAVLRKTRYAQGALAELVHPNSKRALAVWIPQFASTIHDLKPPSPSAVTEWVRTLRVEGVDALVAPERRRGNRSFRFSPEIELLVLEAVDVYMEEEHRDANDVLSFVVGRLTEQGSLTKDGATVDIPSERTIRRMLNRIDPYLLTRLKKGRVAAERMARAAGKSIISPRPLMLVQIDTHFLKVFVVDPKTRLVLGKATLCCVFDVRTRCVVGKYVSLLPASTTTTLVALKDMVTRPGRGLPGGVPITIVPDNGVEFKNSGVENLLRKLKVNFEPAKVRDPNGKAHVESFFRTLSLFLIQKIKGTTFSNLDKRGEYPSEERAYATLEQIDEYITEWIENEYHQRPHSSTRRIPIRMWQEETANAPPFHIDEETANVLARRIYPSAIRKGRVTLRRLSYYSHALRTLEASFRGKVNVLVDELDLSHVLIEHPFEKGVLIQADSTNPEYTAGLSMWEHEKALIILDEMTKKDLDAVGKHAWLLARYRLLLRVQEDSQYARSVTAKLLAQKNGARADVADVVPHLLDEALAASDICLDQEGHDQPEKPATSSSSHKTNGPDDSPDPTETDKDQTSDPLDHYGLPDILYRS